jgi:hypothetical protein
MLVDLFNYYFGLALVTHEVLDLLVSANLIAENFEMGQQLRFYSLT